MMYSGSRFRFGDRSITDLPTDSIASNEIVSVVEGPVTEPSNAGAGAKEVILLLFDLKSVSPYVTLSLMHQSNTRREKSANRMNLNKLQSRNADSLILTNHQAMKAKVKMSTLARRKRYNIPDVYLCWHLEKCNH